MPHFYVSTGLNMHSCQRTCTFVTGVKMHTSARSCVHPRHLCENAHARTNMRAPSSLVLCENSHERTIKHRDALVCKCTRVQEHAPSISDNIITFIICSYQKDEVDDDQQGDRASVSKSGPWHALGPPTPHPIDVSVQERAALGQLS